MSSSKVLVALLVLIGCGAGGGGFHGEFVEACNESGEGSEEFCECMADAADENLNDEQKEYVLAGMQGDEARAAELQEEMGMEGAEEVGAFMASAFECGAAEAEAQGM
ncbi:MAG TPA: hypothetical protein VFM44_01440 [Gemmatimonadota bacterium]|nr:hypothetical protein [Gemmatimonadota bacterium]